MIRLRALAVVAMLILPGGMMGALRADAQSASPESLAAANELFSMLSKDMLGQLVTSITGQVWPQLERKLRSQRPDIDAKTLADLRGEFEGIQKANLALVMSEAPAIYARHFTAAELREILAFYRTPTGAKALREMPQVMSEAMAAMMPRMQEVQTQTMDAFTKALRQRGFNI
jgi:hypothetical protein